MKYEWYTKNTTNQRRVNNIAYVTQKKIIIWSMKEYFSYRDPK